MLSRRKFIGLAGGVGAAGATGTALWATLVRDAAEQAADQAATPEQSGAPATSAPTARQRRTLVVLQLSGGNDGLNTVIPSSGRYRDARATIAIPEDQRVAIGHPDYALHPQLASIAPLYEAAGLAIVEGIGIKEQSRSHFKAQDTWWAASPAASTTGWLGRYLDATAPSPAKPNPLRAIALGGGSPALASEHSLATAVLQPANFAFRAPAGCDAKTLSDAFLACAQPLTTGNDVLAAAQAAIPDSARAIELLQKVKAAAPTTTNPPGTANPPSTGAPASTVPAARSFGANSATALLQSAAGIIELDVGTEVILVNVGGFDTHADQLQRQSDLLADVGNAIAQFATRIAAAGKSNEVLLITTSEFGRRVAQNASNGTDHGLAGVQFIAGAGVKGKQIVGEAKLDALVDGDVPLALDTRSLYANALDWLGGPTDEILGARYDRLGLLR